MKRSAFSIALFTLTLAHATFAAPKSGAIDSVFGNGQKDICNQPFGVEIGPDGALYVCEVGNHRITRVDLKTGKHTVVAGTGKAGYSGDGGPATKAELNEPYEVRFDVLGDMYLVEMKNHIIRRVDSETGKISTIAGKGKAGFGGDGGPAVKAMFNRPHSLALDAVGHIYVADIGNHRIRRIHATKGVIETIAGNGEKKMPKRGHLANNIPVVGPRALFVTDSDLWIALREGHSVWKMNLGTGRLAFVAGTGKKGFTDGDANEATFNGPKGITVDADGHVYIVDTENQVIRKIDADTREVSTIAGIGPKARGYGGDGHAATKAKMDRPHGICVDAKGILYIGDTNNHRVRRVMPWRD